MDKSVNIVSLVSLIDLLRTNNQKIVFTNGCFDLLHPGHMEYLISAKQFGDVLIVGINSDNSVKALKGDARPINTITDRICMLAALESVDFIIEFDEATPLDLIQTIKPDILVKGGDYKISEIVGSDFVFENGGSVEIIPFKSGYSTSALIQKIKDL